MLLKEGARDITLELGLQGHHWLLFSSQRKKACISHFGFTTPRVIGIGRFVEVAPFWARVIFDT